MALKPVQGRKLLVRSALDGLVGKPAWVASAIAWRGAFLYTLFAALLARKQRHAILS